MTTSASPSTISLTICAGELRADRKAAIKTFVSTTTLAMGGVSEMPGGPPLFPRPQVAKRLPHSSRRDPRQTLASLVGSREQLNAESTGVRLRLCSGPSERRSCQGLAARWGPTTGPRERLTSEPPQRSHGPPMGHPGVLITHRTSGSQSSTVPVSRCRPGRHRVRRASPPAAPAGSQPSAGTKSNRARCTTTRNLNGDWVAARHGQLVLRGADRSELAAPPANPAQPSPTTAFCPVGLTAAFRAQSWPATRSPGGWAPVTLPVSDA